MKHLILAAGLGLMCACVQPAHSSPEQIAETSETAYSVMTSDFQTIVGDGWVGTLSYLDYSKETWEEIPVKLKVETPKKRSISYAIKYPGESRYNTRERIKLSSDGTVLNGDKIIMRETLTDGTLRVLTEAPGKDDGKPATIRTEYLAGAARFVVKKYVRFDGETEFFQRNEFNLAR